jgi:hypothetical protein
VTDWFIKRGYLTRAMIVTHGFGKTRPSATDATAGPKTSVSKSCYAASSPTALFRLRRMEPSNTVSPAMLDRLQKSGAESLSCSATH